MSAGDRIAKLKEKARKENLVVLVWGPGDPGPDGKGDTLLFWEKRVQIRQILQDHFSDSEILFSESDALRDHTRRLEDLLAEELVHAAIADCILVLDVSRGAHVEVDRFSENPRIAAKIRVLIPDRYVGTKGLVGVVHNRLRVIGFSEDEFKNCTLAREKCVAVVETIAMQKFMSEWGFVR